MNRLNTPTCDTFTRGDSDSDNDGRNGHFRSRSPSSAKILVVAATNRVDHLDPALVRRFGIRVLVGTPSKKDRIEILSRLVRDVDNNLSEMDLEAVADRTDGWTGSDLESLSREAAVSFAFFRLLPSLPFAFLFDNTQNGFYPLDGNTHSLPKT